MRARTGTGKWPSCEIKDKMNHGGGEEALFFMGTVQKKVTGP